MSRVVLLALLALAPHTALAARIDDAVVFGARLVCVGAGGTISAWSVETGEPDRNFAAVLSSRPISLLASGGATLWALSGRSILRLAEAQDAWVEQSLLPAESEDPIALLSLEGEAVVVYPKKVVRPAASRTYEVPQLGGQLSIDHLRVLARYVAPPNIYFGTGQGEWGGHLVRLNTESGEWSFHYDPLHYATGIARISPGEVAVTWSMSHFFAETLVRIHNEDTTVKREYPKLESKYFQSVAYEPLRRVLYAVEQNDLVEIREGKPHRVAKLGKLSYEPERDAIGVAPGILGIFPLPDASLLVVHRTSPPMVMRNGRLRAFPEIANH